MRALTAAVFLLAFAPPSKAAIPSSLRETQNAFEEVIARARPAVVNIRVTQEQRVQVAPEFLFGDPQELFEQFFGGPPPRQAAPRVYHYQTQGIGSGFIIDPSGLVLTNEHVVRGADSIEITLNRPGKSDLRLPGRVIGKDPSMDLAVVKIQAQGPFPYVKLADSSQVKVGDWAIAIGSPFELQQTVTLGIISALRQSLVIEGRRYPNLLQTDASINRGNSGGPLLDVDGNVIGINTAIYSPAGVFAGIGFAIPADEAKAELRLLENGQTIQRGWLGVGLVAVDEVIRDRFGLSDTAGALINKVFKGSPAERAGLRRGDVIVEIGGRKTEGLPDVLDSVSRAAPGARLKMTVLRSGTTLELTVALSERPRWAEPEKQETEIPQEAPAAPAPRPSPPPQSAAPGGPSWEGIAVRETPNGAQVYRISRSSKLSGYLREGDILQGINRRPVKSASDFKKAVKGAHLDQGVVFDVLRDGQPLYVSVQAN